MRETRANSPYLHGGKRDNDVVKTEWPYVTETELAEFLRTLERYGESGVNPDLYSLLKARQAIFAARLALNEALRHWKGKTREDVVERLREVDGVLEGAMERFPVTVVGK